MIAELFLLCALALPAQGGVDRFADLKAFMDRMTPNHEFYLTDRTDKPAGKHWQYTGFKWRGEFYVWARVKLRSA